MIMRSMNVSEGAFFSIVVPIAANMRWFRGITAATVSQRVLDGLDNIDCGVATLWREKMKLSREAIYSRVRAR